MTLVVPTLNLVDVEVAYAVSASLWHGPDGSVHVQKAFISISRTLIRFSGNVIVDTTTMKNGTANVYAM